MVSLTVLPAMFRLRALVGSDKMRNGVHGSSNLEHAQQEIKSFFDDVNFDSSGRVVADEGTIAVIWRSVESSIFVLTDLTQQTEPESHADASKDTTHTVSSSCREREQLLHFCG